MINTEQNTLDDQVSQSVDTEQVCDVQDFSKSAEYLDSCDKKIMDLEAELAELQQRERDNLLRFTADMENLRRRTDQDIEKTYKFALERFMCELLPVIDNLERALNMLNRNSNGDAISIITGIELTHKSFLDATRKFGLEIVSDINVPFNPEVHQAMSIIESKEYSNNQVISIIQKGYILNGRLIRPAMVTVSKIIT